jgi:hypothetical protein
MSASGWSPHWEWPTYLANLLRLRVPLGPVLVVLETLKLAQQQEYLRDDNFGEALVG